MIKNYIFDFGRVLVDFDADYLTSVYVDNEDDRKAISEVVFDRLYWDRLDDGTITDDEVKKSVCARLPENLHALACEVYDGWINNLPQIAGMRELIVDIKSRGGKLFLLSNISKGFADNYKSQPELDALLALFDGLVFSGSIGLIKPDKEIFLYLLEKFQIKAEESIFIDDSMKNISGAKAAGIDGYLFDGDVEKLCDFLFGNFE